MTRRKLFLAFLLSAGLQSSWGQSLTLPLKPGSVRFAVIGDNGTGGKAQYEVAEQMELDRAVHAVGCQANRADDAAAWMTMVICPSDR